MRKGVLLINLGTPDNCHPKAVKRYLSEFLNDPRVIDLPYVLRKVLVNFIILPFRYKKSAAAYQKIWTDSGSPLLVNSQQCQAALSSVLGRDYQVELGMRYGQPSIQSALAKLHGVTSLHVIPLFPQYSSAATASALQVLFAEVAKKWNIPAMTVKNDFYNHPGFITAYADVIKQHLQHKKIDLLLFSYHGLPERHINKSECIAFCNRLQGCPQIDVNNHYCYRSQCFITSSLLAKVLGLKENEYAVSFQSRLGRTPWIKPYTDLLLPELRQQGVKSIAIVCPSFVSDCLETLEEIDIRAREQWLALGGESFTFIPCLNDHPMWVKTLESMVLA
jgi:protoporphyrin/coproporphyrin ferrochelatase